MQTNRSQYLYIVIFLSLEIQLLLMDNYQHLTGICNKFVVGLSPSPASFKGNKKVTKSYNPLF